MRPGDIVVRNDEPAYAGRVAAILPGWPMKARVRWGGIRRLSDEPILSLTVVSRELLVFKRMKLHRGLDRAGIKFKIQRSYA